MNGVRIGRDPVLKAGPRFGLSAVTLGRQLIQPKKGMCWLWIVL